MAASIKVLRTGSSKVVSSNRITFKSQRQTNRSWCHISIQEPTPSLAKIARPHYPVNQPTIGRSIKLLQNRLLSDQISSAMNARTLGVFRPYSVLPERALYTTPFWQHEESAASTRKCWKCGTETDPMKELFFCTCGIVQSPADQLTFFTLFNIDESFDVDLKKLGEMYKDLQKKLHPDRFSQKSETEQSLAEQQSSLLNKAYFTLLKPLTRALYLLEIHGYTIEEDNNDINPEFLMEVLELNERIGEASSEEIQEIESEISSKIQENVKQLSSAFTAEDFKKARDIAVKMRYYVNVEAKVKTFYRDRM
ncbi:hypothetical protein V1264_001959 [Littorina saxatilis]|uniref:J domain-containing protein n=1 Tax=Littorina saxatilis TaxID=31220 RepID=A0AAN9C2J9_9CAEN